MQKKNRYAAILLSVRDRIRTHDLLVRSQTLYPAELRAPGIESVSKHSFNVRRIKYHIQNKKSNAFLLDLSKKML